MKANYGQKLLKNTLIRRKLANPSYSLRAFARDLEIDRSTLSAYLSGQRSVSIYNARKLRDKLSLDENSFSKLILQAQKNKHKLYNNLEYKQIEDLRHNIYHRWYYFAVLSLAGLEHNLADPEWIAQRLGITKKEAIEGLNVVLSSGFVQIKNGHMIRREKNFTSSNNISKNSIKDYHRQILELAGQSLRKVPVDQRYITSVNVKTSKEKFTKATGMIHRFQRQLVRYLESGSSSELFVLNLSLFPLNFKKE